MIPQRNLSLISNKLTRADERRILESVIERDYVLAWFLTALAGHPLREILAFKGGTALRRCWYPDYRFSEDLDFSLIEPIVPDELLRSLDEIFAAIESASGIQIAFDRHDRHNHQNSLTFYLRYQGPLPTPNDVKVDVTINELLYFPLVDRPIYCTYTEFDDLPHGPTIRVYSLEEIVVEKLLALSDPARSEPRDLYDLSYVLENSDVRVAELRNALKEKLSRRQRPVSNIAQSIAAKEARLRALWKGRLAQQMSTLPPFNDIFRKVMREIRAAGLP